MSSETALWMLLMMSVVLAAIGAPLTWQFRQEMKQAKAKVEGYVAIGLMAAVLGAVALGLWWYYALATDQVLLGVIPTVGYVSGRISNAMTARVKASA